jgi:hypothetical protein
MCLGIFVESIRLVALDMGFEMHTLRYEDGVVNLLFKNKRNKGQKHYSSLLKERCSDRSIYRPISINNATIHALTNTSSAPDTTTRITTDKVVIERVALLTGKAMNTALSSPDFRKELANYLVLPWSSKSRGIAVKSLRIPFVTALLQPLMLKLGVGINNEGEQEKKRWLSASAVIFITAKGDMPHFWFNAGMRYLQVCLAVAEQGLSQATSAAIVEASNYHEDIEDLLHTNERILAVIRIGKGSAVKHHSPRAKAEELITSN